MNFLIKNIKIVIYICEVIVKKIHINYKIHYYLLKFFSIEINHSEEHYDGWKSSFC
jgi:hypothetical protein